MNNDEKAFLMEIIRYLQAGQIAQARVLRALISTHPEPEWMRRAFARYSSDLWMQEYLLSQSEPERAPAHAAIAQAIEDWRSRLERDLPKDEPLDN